MYPIWLKLAVQKQPTIHFSSASGKEGFTESVISDDNCVCIWENGYEKRYQVERKDMQTFFYEEMSIICVGVLHVIIHPKSIPY